MAISTLALLLAAKPAISIRLSAPKAVYKSGELIVLAATATNHTKDEIELVTEQDSMHWFRKAPYCNLESRQPDGKWAPVYRKDVGRCGNANPLKESDFVNIAPGKSSEILRGMEWSKYEVMECLKTPGSYRLRLRYDTTPKFSDWLGGPLMEDDAKKLVEKTQKHFDRTPKGVFMSNEINVRVE